MKQNPNAFICDLTNACPYGEDCSGNCDYKCLEPGPIATEKE